MIADDHSYINMYECIIKIPLQIWFLNNYYEVTNILHFNVTSVLYIVQHALAWTMIIVYSYRKWWWWCLIMYMHMSERWMRFGIFDTRGQYTRSMYCSSQQLILLIRQWTLWITICSQWSIVWLVWSTVWLAKSISIGSCDSDIWMYKILSKLFH